MRIVYCDESGDDGYPDYSSPIFVLTTIYLHYLNWKDTYQAISSFRKELKVKYGLPVKTEMHVKPFLLDKNPYRSFNFSQQVRKEIIADYCKFINTLNLKIINVAIIKANIVQSDYDVLDKALTYSIQRVENDLNLSVNPEERFMMITDQGRVGKMTKTARKIQQINYIPSQFSSGSYRQEIKSMIEDPLPKDSKESYLIQCCDLVSYLAYLYVLKNKNLGDFPNRLKSYLSIEEVEYYLSSLSSVLNLNASRADKFGIVMYPK